MRCKQIEKRLSASITDVFQHVGVVVSKKTHKIVVNILVIFENRINDFGEDIMNTFVGWASLLETERKGVKVNDRIINTKLKKIEEYIEELDASYNIKKNYEDLMKRIEVLERLMSFLECILIGKKVN